MKNLTIFFSIVFLSSCAFHYGSMSSGTLTENTYYKDIARGYSETKQFFSIGGNSKDALVSEAKKNLHANRPLALGERYANYIVDFKVSYLAMVRHLKCTVSADVVSDMPEGSESSFSDLYTRKTNFFNDTTGLYSVGDTVHIGSKEFVIESFKNNHQVILSRTDKTHKKFVTKLKANVISQVNSYHGFELGEKVMADGIEQTVSGFTMDYVETENRAGVRFKHRFRLVEKLVE